MTEALQNLFAAALFELDDELDWDALGELYCHDGGEHFFPPEQREAIRDAGLRFAGAVGDALSARKQKRPGSDKKGPGRSLYLGAALAELPPILMESILLDRNVRIHNLPGPEVDELNRALKVVGERIDRSLPRFRTDRFDAGACSRVDHVWFTSVLTDPDAFPTLHDELYGRRKTELAVGGGNRKLERQRALELVAAVLDCIAFPCLLTTTDEELDFFIEECHSRKLLVDVPDSARLSPIVGDAVRHCRVRRP